MNDAVIESHLRNRISDLEWQLEECKKVLKWYTGFLRPEDRLNDNGEKAVNVLKKIKSN